MQMDFSHWVALESAMNGEPARRSFSRATIRRVWQFAQPHRRALMAFLAFSVASAVLTVATPMLAGQVVNAQLYRTQFQDDPQPTPIG